MGENKGDDDELVLNQVNKRLRRLALDRSRGYAIFSLDIFYIRVAFGWKTTVTNIMSSYMMSSL